MNIYGCSVLRHLKGNVRCAASAAHDNNVNAVTSTGVHTITHSSSQRTPRASQSSSVRVSVDTCHSAQPDGAGAAQRGSRACGCARHARCARCVACVLHLRRRGAHGGMRTCNSSAISKMILVSPSAGCEGAAVAATTCSCDDVRVLA